MADNNLTTRNGAKILHINSGVTRGRTAPGNTLQGAYIRQIFCG